MIPQRVKPGYKITVPEEVRNILPVKPGDYLLFTTTGSRTSVTAIKSSP